MRPIEQASYWLDTRPPQPVEPLTGKIEADVAIIGAGFTGLWTAHFLRQLEPELNVVVLEQGVAGYGGSGRNAGIISPCLDHSHELAAVHFGQEEADRLAKLGLQNFEELAAFAGNECDFERTGQLHVALTPSQVEACRAMAHGRFLNREETRAELNSPLYLGAAFVADGAIINPIKLVDKLRRDIRLFERSPVTSLAGNIVRTPAGEVRAGKIVLATNAYSHHFFPKLLRHFIPLYDYVLVSEPLTAEQHAAIGWRNRQGVIDGRTFFNYYRLTADNRVLWGTSEAKYYPRNRVDESCDHSEWHYRSLRESFDRHFPQLAGLKWELRVGRTDCLNYATHAILRHDRQHLLCAGLYRPWHRQHPPLRQNSRAHGTGETQRAAKSLDGAAYPVSVPARAAPLLRRRGRDRRATPGGRRSETWPVAAISRRFGYWFFEFE